MTPDHAKRPMPSVLNSALTMTTGFVHQATEADIARFWSKVDASADCWQWKAKISKYGYGEIGMRLHNFRAHRVAYELFVSPVPMGLVLDHLCRNRSCVNPSHLEPVTQRENTLRGIGLAAQRATITHCPAGHEYNDQNTYRSRRNERICRACHRASERARKARKRSGE